MGRAHRSSVNTFMRRILPVLLGTLLLFGCSTEPDIELSNVPASRAIPVKQVSDATRSVVSDIHNINSSVKDVREDVAEAKRRAEETRSIAEEIKREGAAADSEITKSLVGAVNRINEELNEAKENITVLTERAESAEANGKLLTEQVDLLREVAAEQKVEIDTLRANEIVAREKIGRLKDDLEEQQKEAAKYKEKSKARLVYVWIVWGVAALCIGWVILKILVRTGKISAAGPIARWL